MFSAVVTWARGMNDGPIALGDGVLFFAGFAVMCAVGFIGMWREGRREQGGD